MLWWSAGPDEFWIRAGLAAKASRLAWVVGGAIALGYVHPISIILVSIFAIGFATSAVAPLGFPKMSGSSFGSGALIALIYVGLFGIFSVALAISLAVLALKTLSRQEAIVRRRSIFRLLAVLPKALQARPRLDHIPFFVHRYAYPGCSATLARLADRTSFDRRWALAISNMKG